jgi:hypothetical protein
METVYGASAHGGCAAAADDEVWLAPHDQSPGMIVSSPGTARLVVLYGRDRRHGRLLRTAILAYRVQKVGAIPMREHIDVV